MTGNPHLRGWSNEALAVARLYDLTAAAWFDKKHRPGSLIPEPPPETSGHDPRSIDALKAFLA